MQEWKWFSLDELPRNMYSPTKKAIELYQEKQIYKEEEK